MQITELAMGRNRYHSLPDKCGREDSVVASIYELNLTLDLVLNKSEILYLYDIYQTLYVGAYYLPCFTPRAHESTSHRGLAQT